MRINCIRKDTNGVIRGRKSSKDRKYNGQKKIAK